MSVAQTTNSQRCKCLVISRTVDVMFRTPRISIESLRAETPAEGVPKQTTTSLGLWRETISRERKLDMGADVYVIPDRIYKYLFNDVPLHSPSKVPKGPSQKVLTVLGAINKIRYYKSKTFESNVKVGRTKRASSFGQWRGNN